MPPHRRPQNLEPHSPEHRRDIAIASAAQAFAVLCESLTELCEVVTTEFREERESK